MGYKENFGRYKHLRDGSKKLEFDSKSDFSFLKEHVSKEISYHCGNNACSKDCTDSLCRYVDIASEIMWDYRKNISAFATDFAFVQEHDYDENLMPLWTRSKTGAKSHQMIGNEITAENEGNENGLFVDRLFY